MDAMEAFVIMRRCPCLVVTIFALAGCSHIFQPGGTRASVKADVSFVTVDNKPVKEAAVYVVETVGKMRRVTQQLITNAEGQVSLAGDYCLPMVVAVRGGNVVVRADALTPSYYIVVNTGDQPTLEGLFGAVDPKYLGYTSTHKGCG